MRLRRALAAAAVLLAVRTVDAGQTPAAQQPFRTTTDIIRLDVSVLGKDRRPVRGLTAGDFTVLENGKPQHIVAVSEVDAFADDPQPSAWMRYAARDVANNDLGDQLGNGQAIAIVMDDDHAPYDDTDIIVATRDAARYIVNSMGPSDIAAVVFPFRVGATQDFTTDRSKLLDAIEKFKPRDPNEPRILAQYGPGPVEGDIRRYSPILGLDPCLQAEPLLPSLRMVTARLSTAPNQRKSIFLLSPGAPVRFDAGGGRCQGMKYDEMRQTFRQAERWNINIHGIDAAGYRGFENYLTQSHVIDGRLQQPLENFDAHMRATTLQEFLKVVTDQTGGRAVIDSPDVNTALDAIFEENSAYYVIGYETSNGNPDGKFRHVDVKVGKADLIVHTKSGYWAPDKTDLANAHKDAPSSADLSLAGLEHPEALALRAVAHPLQRLSNGDFDVAAVVTVRVPAPRQAMPETLTLVRSVTDLDGRSEPPQQQTFTRTVEPDAGDVARYDVFARFPLAPGRYEIRFNATSAMAEASGSVYAELEVPDPTKGGLTVPGIVLGVPPPPDWSDPLASVMPIIPTTSREFTKNDRVTALVRVFQGGSAAVDPVSVEARILGADNVDPITTASTLPAAAFLTDRSALFQMNLPLDTIAPGMHLLSVTFALPDGRSRRRDVVFRVRQ